MNSTENLSNLKCDEWYRKRHKMNKKTWTLDINSVELNPTYYTYMDFYANDVSHVTITI